MLSLDMQHISSPEHGILQNNMHTYHIHPVSSYDALEMPNYRLSVMKVLGFLVFWYVSIKYVPHMLYSITPKPGRRVFVNIVHQLYY